MDPKVTQRPPSKQAGFSDLSAEAEKLKAALKGGNVMLGALGQYDKPSRPAASAQALDDSLNAAEKLKAALQDGNVKLSDLGLQGGTNVPDGATLDHHQLDHALEGIEHENITLLLQETLKLIEQEIAENIRLRDQEDNPQDEAELAASLQELGDIKALVQKHLDEIRAQRLSHSHGAKIALGGLAALGMSLISRTRDVVKRNEDSRTRASAHAGDPVGRAIAEGAAFTTVGAVGAAGISFVDPLSWKMSEYAQNFRMVLGALTFGCEHIQEFPAFEMFLEDAADRIAKETPWPPGTTREQKDAYIRQKVMERWQMLEADLQAIRSGRKSVGDVYQELYNGPADDLLNGKKATSKTNFFSAAGIDLAGRETSIKNLNLAAHYLVPNQATPKAMEPILTLVENGIEPMLAGFLREDIALLKQYPEASEDSTPHAPGRLEQLDIIASKYHEIMSPRAGQQLGYS